MLQPLSDSSLLQCSVLEREVLVFFWWSFFGQKLQRNVSPATFLKLKLVLRDLEALLALQVLVKCKGLHSY